MRPLLDIFSLISLVSVLHICDRDRRYLPTLFCLLTCHLKIFAQFLPAKQAVSFATSLWSVADSIANAMATTDHNASGSSVSLLLQTPFYQPSTALQVYLRLVNHTQT